jgi:molybdenum cofactor cytidylyltransferase
MLKTATVRPNSLDQFTGILLAAGKGSRFDPTGAQNKLLQPLASGDPVVVAAARNLLAVLPTVLAVVRPGADAVATRLRALGCQVAECPAAEQGMGASLVYAISQSCDSAGWVIALGDMPNVQSTTISALIDAIMRGAHIAAPTYAGNRGNPVAFSRRHYQDLLGLGFAEGARNLLRTFPFEEVAVEDAGICQDIDTVIDLALLA